MSFSCAFSSAMHIFQPVRKPVKLSSDCPPSVYLHWNPLGSSFRSLNSSVATRAHKDSKAALAGSDEKDKSSKKQGDGEMEEEVEISWVEEKIEDLVQYTGSTVRAIPGPRVGGSELPWLVALPIGYVVMSLAIAVVKTVRKLSSPRQKRRRQIETNAFLCESLSTYLPSKRQELDSKKLLELGKKCNFDTKEVVRKFLRYALNEKPFSPELVADLIHLRKVSKLEDQQVVEILNDISQRIVKAKGPVVMDTRGFTEKGLKRKAAVQALFSKILYLAELDEFCSTANRSSLSVKEIFGVTDEDANLIRIETLSDSSDVESFEKMAELLTDGDTEDPQKIDEPEKL